MLYSSFLFFFLCSFYSVHFTVLLCVCCMLAASLWRNKLHILIKDFKTTVTDASERLLEILAVQTLAMQINLL